MNISIKEFYAKRHIKKKYKNLRLRKRLQDLIKSRGLTEKEFAQNLGISFDLWILIRDGHRRPKFSIEKKISQMLDREPRMIFLSKYIGYEKVNFTTADKI